MKKLLFVTAVLIAFAVEGCSSRRPCSAYVLKESHNHNHVSAFNPSKTNNQAITAPYQRTVSPTARVAE